MPYKMFPRHLSFRPSETMASGSVFANWGSLILRGVHPTGNEIGVGAYGRVFEVNYEGTLCAAKEVHALLLQCAQGDDLQKIKDDFLSECKIWSTLRHPYIVQFLGSVILVVYNDCDCDVIRSVLSRNEPVQITCNGNGEVAT